ncbi:MAG TPA: metallophosphoesterase family protein [Candidatus Binatia bacterium]|jgi:serine/threonine protein phosphatase 1|nr:metallophosphoesterase family protein [Candidatus Binatia bacterium]
MSRLFAIGDIHGCVAELGALLDGLPLAQGDTVCFVGDYIDRGKDSRGVIDLLLAFGRREDVRSVFLKGNHEDMCLSFLGRPGRWGESWLVNGGAEAVRSYGVDARSAPAAVEAAMPEEHLKFLEGLERSHRALGYLMVHAGIRPDRRWEEQTDEDLFWIREEFIMRPHALPETIVYGHTPGRQVHADLPYKIGIDTGCVYGGCLTALELPEQTVHQVFAGERRVRRGAMPASRRRA